MTGSAPSNNAMSSSWAATASQLGSFMNTAKQINNPSGALGGKRRRSKKGSKKRTKRASKKTKKNQDDIEKRRVPHLIYFNNNQNLQTTNIILYPTV